MSQLCHILLLPKATILQNRAFGSKTLLTILLAKVEANINEKIHKDLCLTHLNLLLNLIISRIIVNLLTKICFLNHLYPLKITPV